MWTPFAIDAKGEEMKTKRELQTKGEHELLSSMTKGEIVDEIVINANMELQWPWVQSSILLEYAETTHEKFII